ncbi:MAG TPA: FtsX-like permease family protein [Dehalococcoidia bacterium]|nr:FtsX-like permease family protein [Dehalococcoidia bacterium]
MNSLFGIPMNDIMIVLVALLAVSLGTIVFIALRNRVMFLIGLRNIPRRTAQTVLIIIGLMLSTVIISAAFTTGDTVDHSITKMVYDLTGHVDETVQKGDKLSESMEEVLRREPVPQSLAADLEQRFQGDSEVNGFLPVISEPVAVSNPGSKQSAPLGILTGLDASRMAAFPDVVDEKGNPVDIAALADDEVLLNESMADEIDAKPGDSIDVYYQNEGYSFRVAEIVKDRLLTGSSGYPKLGLATRLDTVQRLFNRPEEVDFIAIANRGGVRGGVEVSDSVTVKLEDALKGTPYSVDALKSEGVDQAELAGNILMTFFMVLGLFSIGAGILLTVMIFVMLAAERKTEMGISRAVGMKRRHLIESFVSEGMGYNMLSALVGVTLGVLVATLIAGVMTIIIGQYVNIESKVTLRSLVMSYSLGVSLTFLTVLFSSWRASNLNIVRAIRDLPEPEKRPGRRSLFLGIGLVLFGALLMFAGVSAKQVAPWALGISLGLIGVALASRYLGAPERPLFTTVGLAILVYWAVAAGERVPGPEMSGGIELFFLSGIMMVAAATFVVMYNAHLLLNLLALGGQRMGRIFPSIKTAVAYPLASKFRTGMTMAMIALVIFALTMMSIMNGNFDRVFLAEEARGGWDIRVQENPSNPIGDLRQALAGSDVDPSKFEGVGRIAIAGGSRSRLRQESDSSKDVDDLPTYRVGGMDEVFLTQNSIQLQSRATGYDSDAAVWAAMASEPSLAVIDAFASGGSGFSMGPPQFQLDGIDPGEKTFDPIPLDIVDAATGQSTAVKIIGVMAIGPSGNFFGLYTDADVVDTALGGAAYNTYYVRLIPGEDAEATAKAIESTLFTRGAQAASLQKEADEQMALSQGFFYLMQGFMGLGLVVGIAAVGVIAFRTVVERRQQIGMLRAIGFSRGQVALSFLLESSFVTLLGIATGLGLAILLSFFLLTSSSMADMGLQGFFIPWLEVIPICLVAYLASLLMTFIPSRQAASIPIAEALRYE